MSRRIIHNNEIHSMRYHIHGPVLPYQRPYHPNDKLSVRLALRLAKLFKPKTETK